MTNGKADNPAKRGMLTLESRLQMESRHRLILSAVILFVSVFGAWYFEVPMTFDTPSPTIVVPLAGCAVGLLALSTGLFNRWRAIKSGSPVLEYAPAPMGGALHGNIRLGRDVAVTGDFTVTLKCYEREVFHDGERAKGRGLRWSSEAVKARADVLATKCLPVSFMLPSKGIAKSKRGQISFTLEVRAPMQGADFYALFSPRLG